MTPMESAIGFIFSFSSVWSVTILAPKSFTSWLPAFCEASCPSCTSARPPCAAFRRKDLVTHHLAGDP